MKHFTLKCLKRHILSLIAVCVLGTMNAIAHGEWKYSISKDGYVTLTEYVCDNPEEVSIIEIPKSITHEGITYNSIVRIEKGVFQNMPNLRSVIFNDVMQYINATSETVEKVFLKHLDTSYDSSLDIIPSLSAEFRIAVAKAFGNCKVYYTQDSTEIGFKDAKHYVYSQIASMFESDGFFYIPTSMSDKTCDLVDIDCSKKQVSGNIGYAVYKNTAGKEFEFGVENIMDYACHGYKGNFGEANALTIKNSGDIHIFAFLGDSISSLRVENNGTIEKNAFTNCKGLSNLSIKSNYSIFGDAFSNINVSDRVDIQCNGDIINAFDYCTADTISITCTGDIIYAFDYSTADTISITCNGTVSGFNDCANLKKLMLNDVTEIDSRSFWNCTSLDSVEIPSSVEYLGGAFYSCTSLKYVRIAGGVKTIGRDAFARDWAYGEPMIINTVILEDSDEELIIDDYNSIFGGPFNSLLSLDSVYIGRTLQYNTGKDYYGKSPFCSSSLRKVTIGPKCKRLHDNLFLECSNIETIEIGEGVEEIGNSVFMGCNLNTITCYAIVPPVCDENAFDGVNKLECALYVPMESIELYKVAEQWKEFYIEGIEVMYNVVVKVAEGCEEMGRVTGSDVYSYGETASLKAVAKDGYVFAGWSDGEKEAYREIKVTSDTTLIASFKKADNANITNIPAVVLLGKFDIYNALGTKIAGDASVNIINNLPKGVYLIKKDENVVKYMVK